MNSPEETPADGSLAACEAETGGAFTLESIQKVRDFTARKTLEQAHGLVTGIRRVLDEAGSAEEQGALLRDLELAGVGLREADEIAAAAVALMDLMADRDRKADAFHAAVKEAGQHERTMVERLASLSRALRAELGDQTAALSGLPSVGEVNTPRPQPSGGAIFSTIDLK